MDSYATSVDVIATATRCCEPDASNHLVVHGSDTRVQLALQAGDRFVTDRDLAIAHRISDEVRGLGLVTSPRDTIHSVQSLEIAIDARDIATVRPFWKAVLRYRDVLGSGSRSTNDLIDPYGLGPSVWFQQMEKPPQQRNRIHLDLTVPHGDAASRVDAAVAARGTLVSGKRARAFWVLADPQGNEVCVCTWQDRE